MRIVLSNGQKMTLETLRAVTRNIGHQGTISIMGFLEAFCYPDDDNAASALAEHMTSVLFRHRYSLQEGCRYYDQEQTGLMPESDFLAVLKAWNGELSKLDLHFSDLHCKTCAKPLPETEMV